MHDSHCIPTHNSNPGHCGKYKSYDYLFYHDLRFAFLRYVNKHIQNRSVMHIYIERESDTNDGPHWIKVTSFGSCLMVLLVKI